MTLPWPARYWCEGWKAVACGGGGGALSRQMQGVFMWLKLSRKGMAGG